MIDYCLIWFVWIDQYFDEKFWLFEWFSLQMVRCDYFELDFVMVMVCYWLCFGGGIVVELFEVVCEMVEFVGVYELI